MIRASIGVFAYNEERTIGQTLKALLEQKCTQVEIVEVLVVSSASTDRTDAIVTEMSAQYPRLRLIREAERRGKACAINRYLADRNRQAEVCIMSSADLLPNLDVVELLVAPFADPSIGMTGGRPVPVNIPDHFMGYVAHLQWKLHHLISLKHPKCGELVAFRADLSDKIPPESPVDEASLEAIAAAKGLQLRYVPDAITRNRGPENIREFIARRRHLANGHKWLQRTTGYRVATGSPLTTLRILAGEIRFHPKEWIWILGAIGLEGYARLLGTLDLFFRPRAHQVWKVTPSTKGEFETPAGDR